MNTHDPAPAPVAPPKRVYQAPQVTDLGDVRDLTRSGGATAGDGRASSGKG